MQIISGTAKRIKLTVPKGLKVRPTSVRARKALFDSLGSFAEARVADLFAGSGALGLEAASQGAAEVLLVEQSSEHCRAIDDNIQKVTKAGISGTIRLVNQNALTGNYFHLLPQPDVIFADPPYPVSIECFQALTSNTQFMEWAAGALLIWEVPDQSGAAESFSGIKGLNAKFRKFGGTDFLLAFIDT